MTEQRYQAVLAVIADGATVTEVAARFGVMRLWLRRYEALGGRYAQDALVEALDE